MDWGPLAVGRAEGVLGGIGRIRTCAAARGTAPRVSVCFGSRLLMRAGGRLARIARRGARGVSQRESERFWRSVNGRRPVVTATYNCASLHAGCLALCAALGRGDWPGWDSFPQSFGQAVWPGRGGSLSRSSRTHRHAGYSNGRTPVTRRGAAAGRRRRRGTLVSWLVRVANQRGGALQRWSCAAGAYKNNWVAPGWRVPETFDKKTPQRRRRRRRPDQGGGDEREWPRAASVARPDGLRNQTIQGRKAINHRWQRPFARRALHLTISTAGALRPVRRHLSSPHASQGGAAGVPQWDAGISRLDDHHDSTAVITQRQASPLWHNATRTRHSGRPRPPAAKAAASSGPPPAVRAPTTRAAGLGERRARQRAFRPALQRDRSHRTARRGLQKTKGPRARARGLCSVLQPLGRPAGENAVLPTPVQPRREEPLVEQKVAADAGQVLLWAHKF